MAKNIIKQVMISLLMIIAFGLVIALAFYQFIPSNKIVPTKVQAYSTPQNVAGEIADTATEQKYETVNEVYEVTDADLAKYKSTKSYNPGKSDPFATYSGETTNSTEISDGNSSKSSTNTDSNAKDQYYEEAGINKGTK